jgi:hypothetical protein
LRPRRSADQHLRAGGWMPDLVNGETRIIFAVLFRI